VSLDRTGEGAAVSRQLDDARDLAALRGWTVVTERSDNDTSASGKVHRPGFDALLDDMRAGSIDTVIAWNLDRLTRNRRDTVRLCRSDVVAAFGCLPNAATDALRAAVDAGLLHRDGPRYTPTATSTSAAA
jgi:hypothetical protein